jgi:hypothetical protein
MNSYGVLKQIQKIELRSSSNKINSFASVLFRKNPVSGILNIIGNHGELNCSGRHINQAKLKLGESNDVSEQQADRVANAVMKMPDPQIQRKSPWNEDEEGPIQMKGSTSHDSGKFHNAIAPPIVHEVLNSQAQPLDHKTRCYFEPRFGTDFGNVRVHKNLTAAESAKKNKCQCIYNGK